MEPFLAAFIRNSRYPKFIRTLVVVFLTAFIMAIGIFVGIVSPYVIGKICGYVIAVLFLITGIYLIFQIYKKENK